jgi:hypothetical protein
MMPNGITGLERVNLFICVPNTQTYLSAEILGKIRVGTQAITCT